MKSLLETPVVAYRRFLDLLARQQLKNQTRLSSDPLVPFAATLNMDVLLVAIETMVVQPIPPQLQGNPDKPNMGVSS